MIFESILVFLTGLMSDMPTLTISTDLSIFNVVWNVLRMVCYLIPVHALVPLIAFSISVTVFKIICNVIRAIWSLLPVV